MHKERKFDCKFVRWRRLHKALTIPLLVALLTGLIPPPLARNLLSTPAQAAPLAQSGSQIGNLVWKDLNANGLQDGGEPGLPGVTVGLYNNSGNPVMCPQVSLANLALNQVATQSSLWLGGYEAYKAVDGNSTSTSSMSITGYAAESWWHVDLGQSAEIRQVVIFARPDGSHDQTEQIYVQISNQPFASTNLATTLADPNVWSSPLQGAWTGPSLMVTVPSYQGRYVRIQHSNTNYLSLGEVQVFGNPILPVTAITDPNGQYTFASGNCLQANSTYQVRIATAQVALRGVTLTTQDAGGVTSNDPVADNTDSDAATAVISGTQYSRISPITAPASGANYSYDFGYIPVEIGNRVWKDVSANGLQDGGEPGIAGVTVELLDNSGNPVMCTEPWVYDTYRDNFVTGGINNLSAGTLNWTTSWVQTNNIGVSGSGGNPDGSLRAYAGSTAYYSTRAVDLSVFVTQPTLSFDYDMSGTASQFNIQYSVNGGTTFNTLAILSDNNNGYKSITYTLPSTITVATAQLRIRGQGTGTWAYFDNLTFRGQVNKTQTTVTDASGQYAFTGGDCVQPSGSYRVRIANNQTALQGLFAAIQNAGGVTSNDPVADDTDSDAATTVISGTQYSQINPITAPAAGVNYSYDFGYVPVEIGNRVWKDLNTNGLQDGGEPGLAGVTVELLDNSGNPVMCTEPSTANLALNQVATQVSNYTASYTANKAVDGNSNSTSSMSITGYGAETWWQVDLGQSAKVRQVVIYSRPDGWHSQTEQIHVHVSPLPFASNSLATTLADPNVWSSPLQGVWAGTILTVTVPSYQGRYVRIQHSNTDYLSFGEVQVFGDPDVPVKTVTDASGQYTFTGVDCVQPSGNYRVRIANNQEAVRGLFATTQDAGGVTNNDPVADDSDSDAATVTVGGVQYSQINPITAPAAGVNYSYDFGYVPVEIGNVVWQDTNRNNLQDGGEPGLAGLTVELLDNSGNPVMCTDPGVYDTYRDVFTTAGVNNQSAGTLNWTTSWVQTNNAGVIGSSGNPDGSLQAYAGSTAYYSTRAVNLSVFATTPTLSFDYDMSGTASQFNIQYSVDGGTIFNTLAVLSDNNNGYKSITYTLPSTITVATAQLRIRGQGTGTWAYFDNLTFRGQVNKVQTTVTDASGQYTFTGADCVQPNGSYRLRIANNQPGLDGFFAVSQNASGVTSNDPMADINDSDAVTTTVGAIQYSLINPVTAPAAGVNYSYDFGYKLRLPTLQITKKIIGGNTTAPFPLTIYGPGGAVINTTVISGTPTILENIPTGVYTVTEQSFPIAPAGYYWVTTPAYTPASGTANVITGTVAQVQITNILAQTSFPQATLTLTKTVMGSAQSNYSVRLIGPSHPTGQIYNIISGTNTITNLMTGVYTVTEISPGAGWVTTYTVGALNTTSSAVVSLTNSITTPVTTAGAIQGTVYRDYNSDGNLQQSASYYESGQSGVIVTAYDRNGLVAGTATTNNSGVYTLNTTRTGPYRLSFSNIPAGYEPSRVTNGTQNGTSTQFVSAPASNVNLAINQPCDYCQNSPQLVLTEMTYGDPMLAPFSNFPALIRFNYDYPGALTTDTTIDKIGATWGLTYHRTNRLIFVSAFQRRFTGFGPLGTGGIYYFNRNTNTLVNWLDVNSLAGVDTGADPHTTLPAVGGATPVRDPASFDAVGKIGLGDIDLSTDERTLWAVNLNQRTLLEIPVTGNPPAVPTTVKVHDLSNKVTCTNGVFRPWGLKFYNNKIYVGGVCTAENGGTQSNLSAHVLVHDPAGPLSSFSQIFSMPLDYAKGCSLNFGGIIDCDGWNVWQTNWPTSFDPGGGGYTAKTQPILSDIEFDIDGSMILGFGDRWGYQTGHANYQPNPPDGSLYYGTTGGDIIRACLISGSYVAEGSTGCLKLNTDTTTGSVKEYYQDTGSGFHPEATLGALAFLPGRGEVVSTKLDPQSVFAVGTTWIKNSTGDIRQEFNTMGNPFNKASSIGDIELLCDPAPLEIGNRVWWDMDGDGVQDGGEPGMSNIQVSLQSPTNTVTANTNASGHYYFAVSPNTAYTLTLNVPAGYSLTPAHRAALSGAGVASNHPFSDTIDSDAVLISNKATIFYTTGGPGQNNHGLDFGFGKSARGAMRIRNTAPPPIYDLALRKTLATAGPFNVGQTVTFNLTVFNQGNVTATHISLVDYIPASLTLADTTNWQVAGGQATSVGHNAHIHDLAAGGVATRTIALTINAGFSGTITNTAEIMAAVVTDALGNPLTVDTDSTPDNQNGNQSGEQAPTRKDDNISENGKSSGDEDDHDFATLTIAPLPPKYALRKTLITPDPVRVGDDISFTIRITNTGSNAITVLPLRDIYDRSDIIFDYAIVAPDEGSNDGQLDWSDLTVGFGQDLAPGASFTVTTFFVARHDTSFLPGGATINTALSPISPTLMVTAPVRIEAPTGVDLASHSATYDLNNGVTLAWTTTSEAEIAGFHLLRRELGSGGWVRLNPEMIPAQQPGQATGASYSFSDTAVQFGHTYLYMVEMVDASGNTSRRELGLVTTGSQVLLPIVMR